MKENLIYIDTIYNPLETKTLKYLKDNVQKRLIVRCLSIKDKNLFIYGIKKPEIDNDLINLLTSKLQ